MCLEVDCDVVDVVGVDCDIVGVDCDIVGVDGDMVDIVGVDGDMVDIVVDIVGATCGNGTNTFVCLTAWF